MSSWGVIINVNTRRWEQLQRIPFHLVHSFYIVPKLAKDDLYGHFIAARALRIMSLQSRDGTLGITHLEAALSGVTTKEYWFPPPARNLADLVGYLNQEGLNGRCYALTCRVGKEFPEHTLQPVSLQAWKDFSSNFINLT